VQACRHEIPRLCRDVRNPLECLESKLEQVLDHECEMLVIARKDCYTAVTTNYATICQSAESAKYCLRRVSSAVLPRECAASEFYRSILLSTDYAY
jgi:hypothetical protein